MDKLLKESEENFAAIVTLLDQGDDSCLRLARTLAWRMNSRLEEARLRHPII